MNLWTPTALLVALVDPAPVAQETLEVSHEVYIQRLTDEARARANVREHAIQKEWLVPGVPAWAGAYYEGNGSGIGRHLSLAPKTGFHFHYETCMGTADLNFGGVSFQQGRLQFDCEFPNVLQGGRGIEPELLSVPWGQRMYLIDAKHAMRFVNSVNGGSEPRSDAPGAHLLRIGDWKHPVEGLPQLPKEWKPALLKAPIVACCIAVDVPPNEDPKERNYQHLFLDLDVTREDGVLPDMKFYLQAEPTWGYGVVIEVNETHCRVKVESHWVLRPIPEVGDVFSTRR